MVVVYSDYDNVLIYDDEPRGPMKADDGAYYGFEKDMDVDEDVDCTSTKKETYMYDQYFDAKLQIPDKDGMKCMVRVHQVLRYADSNLEDTGSYRAWVDHTQYKIEFCD